MLIYGLEASGRFIDFQNSYSYSLADLGFKKVIVDFAIFRLDVYRVIGSTI